MLIRRVIGESMQPTLRPGQLVFAIKSKQYSVNNLVIAKQDSREVLKRIAKINNGQYFLTGDNAQASTDSRQLGTVDAQAILGRVIWPKRF